MARPNPQMRKADAPEQQAMTAEPDEDEPKTFLTFRLGGQQFALSVAPVREILDEQPVAILPEASADVIGLIDVRGESVVVMDVSRRLRVEPQADHNRRIIVLEHALDFGRPVGVITDQVLSVVDIPKSDMETAPRSQDGGADHPLVQGIARIAGNLVLVLDHTALLGCQAENLFDFA